MVRGARRARLCDVRAAGAQDGKATVAVERGDRAWRSAGGGDEPVEAVLHVGGRGRRRRGGQGRDGEHGDAAERGGGRPAAGDADAHARIIAHRAGVV